MNRFKSGLVAVLVVAAGGLGILVLAARRDAPPPDENEFRAERPEVAPEDNAYTYFLEATNGLVEATNGALLTKYRAALPVDEGEVRTLIEQNAECLALVKRGTECAICLTPPVETIGTPTPYVNSWLHMEGKLSARARLAQVDGRFADAADDLAVGMRFGHLIQKDASCLIVYLVGVAIFSGAAEQALELARDPAAPPETLARLAAELETIGPFGGGLAQALKAEHRMTVHVVDGLRDKREQVAPLNRADFADGKQLMARLQKYPYCFQPNRTKREMAAVHRRLIANTSRIYADLERGGGAYDELVRLDFLRPNVFGKYLFSILVPGLDKTLDTKCRTEGLLAGAKLVVACHRFEREREQFPETLAELVPDYLMEVPPDPFDGQPFRYSAEKGLVWAVGTNRTDEGGSTRVPGSEKEYDARRDRRRAEDFTFDLRAALP